jgi:hypothetical protein
VAILGGLAAWMLHKPEPKLEGTLGGERVTDNEFGPYRLDSRFFGNQKNVAREAIDRLESEPLRAVSPMLRLEFHGGPGGIGVSIRAPDGTEFCRVDPRQDKVLARYLDREKERLEAARSRALAESVPEFIDALRRRSEGDSGLEGLAAFRDSVGLTSIVRGFGRQVQAEIGRKTFPCVLEDADGYLYFSLPVGTTDFEIKGRERGAKAARDDPPFPGRYQVAVAKKPVTVHTEAPDPKEKVRKQLRQ